MILGRRSCSERSAECPETQLGWDPQTGEPTEAKLHELDIAWAAESS